MSAGDLLGRIDSLVGAGVERAIRSHHRRRLRRIGRLGQLDPPAGGLWSAADPAPRAGCEFELLVDGAEALPRIAEALRQARSHVHIAGWHVTPEFGLTRGDGAIALRDLLGELAEQIDVRVLLWAGSPVRAFTPDRREVREVRDELQRGTRVRCELDSNERPMHCHHEKLVVVDDEIAFVGGIDLTSLAGDRFDSSEHAMLGRLGWHDVAARVRGPAVADVAAHFAARWHATTGEQLPTALEPSPVGERHLQIVRTVPERVYDFAPNGDFGILESYTRALRAARELVYLESQFLWSPEIVAILADKLRNPPTDRFRIVTVLPAKPNNGDDSTRGQLGVLARADDGAERFLACTLRARSGRLGGPLYVHAKVGIVDDHWLTVGSANLNEHSLFNDTEMNVVTCDPDLARAARLRLWSEHLECEPGDVGGDACTVVDERWRPIAREQLERSRRGEPPTHRLCELPGVSARTRALRGPLDTLVVDG